MLHLFLLFYSIIFFSQFFQYFLTFQIASVHFLSIPESFCPFFYVVVFPYEVSRFDIIKKYFKSYSIKTVFFSYFFDFLVGINIFFFPIIFFPCVSHLFPTL